MTIAESDWIWHGGTWTRWNEAQVHVSAHALHYGSSVFEGIRAYGTDDGPAVFRLREHIERLFRSARLLRLETSAWSEDQICDLCVEIVERNGHESCYLRPLFFRDSGTLALNALGTPVGFSLLSVEWGRYLGQEALEQGVDAGISSWRRPSPDAFMPLGKIGGQYVNNQMVTMEARANGYGEGIVLDPAGMVAEGAGENLFLLIGSELVTPPVHGSILAGITRDTVLHLALDLGITVREANVSRDMLYLCDELFMTGTAAEITPVRSVDRMPIGDGTRGPVTASIQDAFFDLIEGRTEDRYAWLTYVSRQEQRKAG